MRGVCDYCDRESNYCEIINDELMCANCRELTQKKPMSLFPPMTPMGAFGIGVCGVFLLKVIFEVIVFSIMLMVGR